MIYVTPPKLAGEPPIEPRFYSRKSKAFRLLLAVATIDSPSHGLQNRGSFTAFRIGGRKVGCLLHLGQAEDDARENRKQRDTETQGPDAVSHKEREHRH